MPIEYKTFGAEVKAFDDTNLTVDHFISTEHKDRGGDIMRAKGMKIVGKPVVLLLHGRGSMGSEPVGKPLSIDVDEYKGQPGILAKTQFFPDEVGTRLYQKVKGGFLPNWSIGYMVDEAKDLMREGKYDGRDVTKWTLLEYSPVGVPMNPFAQTIKEFLDADDAGNRPEIKETPHWFGVVEENESDGLQKCSTCESFLVTFTKEGGEEVGIACEKCQPEEFARLQKEVSLPEPPADPPPDPMKEIGERIAALEAAALPDAIKRLTDAFEEFKKGLAKLEPLLASLPPEPDGGDKGKKGADDNPPEKVDPPRLVFRDSAKEAEDEEHRKAEEMDRTVSAVAEAIRPIFKAQVDKIMGRVP